MTTAPHAAPVVILSAVPEERERLGAMVAEPQDRTMAGTVVRVGTLDGIPVAIAACGIGTIAAAAVTAVQAIALGRQVTILQMSFGS